MFENCCRKNFFWCLEQYTWKRIHVYGANSKFEIGILEENARYPASLGVGITSWLSFLYHLIFVKTIRDITLKLTILVHHHNLHQQTRLHNSVNVFSSPKVSYCDHILPVVRHAVCVMHRQ